MAVAESLQSRVKANPRRVTAVLSVVGYVLVLGAFTPYAPFPSISRETTILLGDAIAVVNTFALVSILLGVSFIRRDEVRKHRAAMLSAFSLIVVFLGMYLLKVGGGFEKSILASGPVLYAYLAMLAVHILLSAVSVPVVLHAVVLGLTHSPAELRETIHARVGRVAAAAWSLSLFLGIVTYVLLNHVYGWEPRGHEALLLLAAGPSWRRLRRCVVSSRQRLQQAAGDVPG
jgi:putative membrane protein